MSKLLNNKGVVLSKFTKRVMAITLTPVLLLMVYSHIFVPKNSRGGTKEWLKQRNSQKQAMTQDPITAWVMAQEFVTQRLKSPSTAKFPWYNAKKIHHIGEGRYKITSYVDSQNSFGAMLRTPFSCVVSHIEGDRWALEWLEM